MSVQVHNAAPELKAALRLKLVDSLGGIGRCSVLETHAGPGVMRELAYSGARDWLGIDTDPQSPGSIHADNREVLRSVDLQRFNFFDVDAYGSPWEQVWIISQRRIVTKGETIALAITSGDQGTATARTANLKLAGWSRQMLKASGASVMTPAKLFTGKRGANTIAQRFVSTWFHDCAITLWVSGMSRGGGAWYFGATLEGNH